MVGGPGPRRALLLSADVGEGHNAAARALADAVRRRWPGCECRRIDTLELRGRPFARFCRFVYRFQLSHTPGVYQFFYDALISHPWSARAAKRLVGSFFGRPLDREIRRFRPDLVLSTYPLGSAALNWCRKARGVAIPAATFVTDFAAHPFWAYPGVDVHFVMHDLARPAVRSAGVRGGVICGALPVSRDFVPGAARTARARLGLPQDVPIVLLTGGAWGIGTVERAVRALIDRAVPVTVVAVCGRNEALRARLEALPASPGRLVVTGFVETMPDLMAAADLVVTNGGGVTNLEALASGRPIAVFDPLAGHGRAGGALMQRAGLAVMCDDADDLVDTVRAFSANRPAARRLREAARERVGGSDLGQDLERLAVFRPSAPAWRRPASVVLRSVSVAAVAILLFVPMSFALGTRLARAARGAPASSREVAISFAGSIPPPVLEALVERTAASGVPATFFLDGRDAVAAGALARRAIADGSEVESALWQGCRDSALRPGDDRAAFAGALAAVERASGRRPRYVAEPCGGFSLLAVEVTGRLHLRRVVFDRRIDVGTGTVGVGTPVPPGAIVEVRVLPGASARAVAHAFDLLLGTVQGQGLVPVTVASIDRTTR